MILRPAICSNSVWIIAALLFGGALMYDTVNSGPEVFRLSSSLCAIAPEPPPPDAWMVPNTLTTGTPAARAFVETWAKQAFDVSRHSEAHHREAAQGITPMMRDGFASTFWGKPSCGHDVKFSLDNVDEIHLGATNGAWFEIKGTFSHGKVQNIPVHVAVLVGGTPQGGMQIEGYSELTDRMEKLLVSSCEEGHDCEDEECDANAAALGEMSFPPDVAPNTWLEVKR